MCVLSSVTFCIVCTSFGTVPVSSAANCKSAARRQLGCQVHAPLRSVMSAAICLPSHDLSAWQQSVSSVCQLSCNMSTQLSCYLKAQLQLVNSAGSSAATCQLSSNLSAQLHPVSSDGTCTLSCTLLAQMKLVIPAATGWPSCSLCPHLYSVCSAAPCSSDVICHLSSSSSSLLHLSCSLSDQLHAVAASWNWSIRAQLQYSAQICLTTMEAKVKMLHLLMVRRL